MVIATKKISVGILITLGLLTWLKSKLVAASLLSLLSTIGSVPTNLGSMSKLWYPDLLEYWIAAFSWIVIVVVLVLQLRSSGKRNPLQKWNGFVAFLLVLTFLSLTSPFLVPVPPNVLGDLVTTRLLPPLSRGYVVETSDVPPSNSTGIEKLRRDANAYLLQRSVSISGTPFHGEEPAFKIVFLFGTDDAGRDVFSRMISGSRVSLAIGFSAAVGAILIGALIGFVAGYSNRFIDSLLMRITDLFLSIPSLFLVISVVAFLGQSILTLVIILAVTGWMSIAIMIRTEVKKLRDRDFVLAAKLFDQSSMTIMMRHIVPNLKPLLITAAVLQFGNAVLAEASLSFLGLGVQAPTASWGNMLGQSLGYLRTGWWLGIFPGALLAAVLISAHYAIEGRRTPA